MQSASPDERPRSNSADEPTAKLVSHVRVEKEFESLQEETVSQEHGRFRRLDSWEAVYDRCVDYLDKIWAVELGAAVVAAVSMIAIAALLRYLDGLSLDAWASKITPNTVLSILSTVSKATMLAVVSASIAQLRWCHFVASPRALRDLDIYDEAGRGIWGSIVFFIQMAFGRHRHAVSWIACLGALLTALAIVVDPSTQQLLEYRTASVPTTNRGEAIMPVSHGPSHGANILSDKAAWQALYGGFLDFDYPVAFTCPGGNCTWPAFASLGICSDCQDAFPFATKDCLSTGNTSQPDDGCTEPVYSTDDSKLVLNLKNGTQPAGSSSETAKTWTLIQSVVSSSYPNGLHDPTLFKFLIAQLEVQLGTDANAKQFSINPNWNLTQCAIRWCSRSYESASVVNGALLGPEPTVVEVQIDSSEVCDKSLCQQLVTNNYAVMPQGKNENYSLILNPAVANIPNLVNFDYPVQAYENGTWDSASIFSVTATMFLNTDIIAAIAKVCDAYTNRLRADAPVNIPGTVLITTTTLQVRWGWLAMPGVLVLATVGFLLSVIAITRRRPQYAHFRWKTSSLPLLCHPLVGQRTGQISQRPKTRTAMEAEVGHLRAQLRESDDGEIRFVAFEH
ncbi:hypothetical protein PRZ48_004229 [Zasmidium cellare]|uniref:Uncharacterized protein n=1 Tax=Zasmidium cellare TaxID=395010 RepID=A0ABR0EY11_ZASCE|nr:hypothetical protein PRZ48_004229 [Zasmidium cellare]